MATLFPWQVRQLTAVAEAAEESEHSAHAALGRERDARERAQAAA